MPELRNCDVLVVGGGAAGLMAALAAARRGKRVVMIDRNREPGRKILASGNGRCNVTNLTVSPEHFPYSDTDFVASVLGGLGPAWLRSFFQELGLETVAQGERVWPASFEARSVRDRLVAACTRAGAQLRADLFVERASTARGGFSIRCTTAGALGAMDLGCKALILSSGGKSYAKLGGSDSGYGIAENLGHSVTALQPGLVPLKTQVAFHHKLQGLKLEALVTLVGKQGAREAEFAKVSGDLLFADYGVSGQAILNLSCLAAREIDRAERDGLTLRINFLGGKTEKEVAAWLLERRRCRPGDAIGHELEGFLPRKLARHALHVAGIPEKSIARRSNGALKEDLEDECLRIATALTSFEVPLKGASGFGHAMVTVGGIRTSEVDPEDMQSRIVPGLHLAGEILNVQGLSGGFNLHFAFASGFRAGNTLTV